MYTGKLTASYTKETMNKNWMELTNLLNSVPEGPAKDWKQWRKTWVDFKKNTKNKFSEAKRYTMGTGGGPPLPPADIEEKLLEIISPVAINGNDNLYESEVSFTFDNSNIIEEIMEPADDQKLAPSHEVEDADKTMGGTFHDYCMPGTSKMESLLSKTSTPNKSKRKRVTKTMRLQESLRTNEGFLKINKENVESVKQYHLTKLEIMKNDCINKKNYYDQKIAALKVIANAATSIAEDVKEIKNYLISKHA